MIIKRLFVSAFCILAMQGAMAQNVDGTTGATSCAENQTKSCCAKKQMTPAKQLIARLRK